MLKISTVNRKLSNCRLAYPYYKNSLSTATANTCRTKPDHKKIYDKEMPINITNNPSVFVLIERRST